MLLLELGERRNAVRAHGHMDRAFGERLQDAAVDDLGERLVVGQIREHDFAPGTSGGDVGRELCARLHERVGLRGRAVIDDEVVVRAENPSGDRLPHAPQANESNSHSVASCRG